MIAIIRTRRTQNSERKRCNSNTARSTSMRMVATLKLDHQEVLNAVSADMLGGLQEALNAIDSKKDRGPLRRADRRRPRVLHRRQPLRPQRPEGHAARQRRLDPRDRLSPVPAPAAQPALPADHVGERTGRRRRHEHRLDGRHHSRGEVGLLPAGVPPHRPGARLRLDLDAAAPGRQVARGRAVAARRAAAGREGAGVGHDQPRLRGCCAGGGDEEARRRSRQRPDRGDGAHPQALLGEPAQLVRGAARPRSADAADGADRARITAKASRRSWKSVRRSSRGGKQAVIPGRAKREPGSSRL